MSENDQESVPRANRATLRSLNDTPLKQWLLELVLFTSAYWLSAQVGIKISTIEHGFSPFWPPSGVALYALLTRGLSLAPGIFIGHALMMLPFDASAPALLALSMAATLESLVSAFVLKHVMKIRTKLSRFGDILRFITIGAIFSPVLISVVPLTTLLLDPRRGPGDAFETWRTFVIGNALGVLIFTPLLLSLKERERKRFDRMKIAEAAALTLVTLVFCEYVFQTRAPIGFIIYPCIFWASIRFGVLGVSTISLMVTLWGMYFTASGRGPFSGIPTNDALAMFQLYIGIGATAGLLMTTAGQADAKRRALKEIDRERRRFQLAAQNASDYILEWDTRIDRIQWSGKIDEALCGPMNVPQTMESFADLIHPEDRNRVIEEVMSHVRSGERLRLSFRVIKKDGSLAYWTASGQAVPDEGAMHSSATSSARWIGAITDVTRQREAEEELKKSEERYQLATSAAGVGVWEWDARTDVNHWSPVAAELMGTQLATSSSGALFSNIHPDDLADFQKKRQFAIDHKEPYFDAEFRIIWIDGSIHWLKSKGQLSFDTEGRPTGARGTLQEITESMRIQDELKNAKEHAEKASDAKMQFLANMSHEIRTPMNAILGFTELLSKEETLSSAKRREFVSRIKSNGDQLLALIDDILDLSKFEAGDVPIEKLHFSFVDMLGELVRTLSPIAEKKHLAIRTEFETAVPQVIVSDPVRIEQILTNLIGNAVKFTDQGSITIRLRFAQAGGDQGPRLIINVDDTGIGINAQAQQRLFQPFSQGDTSMARRFGGTGLGLVLSRRLAHALGGSLVLSRSIPGKGSCFTLTLDPGDVSRSLFVHELTRREDRESAKPKLRPVEQKTPQLKGLRVLLAEDSPDNEALVKLYLSMEGADVLVAHNGAEAVHMASGASDIDLILMDVQMPVMDGLEATRRLRGQRFMKPIVALTAHALQDEVRKTSDAGCDAHLTKPINRATLTRAIALITGRPYRDEQTPSVRS